MFELTNEQRKCFGLLPVNSIWTRITLKPSPYHAHTTLAYLEGTTLRKFIQTGKDVYMEYEICEKVSQDLRYLLPKTPKGKSALLSAAVLEKRTGSGPCLSFRYSHGSSYVELYSHTSQKCYYTSQYDPVVLPDIDAFREWVETWCRETTPEDLEEVAAFAAQSRQHVKYREGDVFRFKINRRLYGYGRLIQNYDLLRKQKVPFWDILFGKPMVCSVYHIVTERNDVPLAELQTLPSLPSVHMMDNRLYYGDFEIIGNIPVAESEDYPIMYGNSISALYRAVLLQCGKLFLMDPEGSALFSGFTNQHIGFGLNFRLSVLRQCIEAGSNAPYWAQCNWITDHDLRNPKLRPELEQVCAQFGLSPSQLLKEI